MLIYKYNGRYSGSGLIAKVGEVLRSTTEQQAKYAQGRTAPGRIVTNADGIHNLSDHQAQARHGETCSHAVDVNIFADNGTRYIDDERWYHALLGLGISVGLLSGGDWGKPDWPHLYCPYGG